MITETYKNVAQTAKDVRDFIRGNGYLPEIITLPTGTRVGRSSFLHLMSVAICQIKDNVQNVPIGCRVLPQPPQTNDNVKQGSQWLLKDYVNVASATFLFIEGNGYAPTNNNTLKHGTLSFYGLIWTFSRILAFYHENKYLPNYAVLENKFKTPTKSQRWQDLESALGKQFNTAEQLAQILQKHPDYEYYYNDMKTPSQTLAALKVAGGAGVNCVDISQVVMYVLKDMGYSNVNIWRGTFNCGGHVWVTYGPDSKVFDAAGMMKYGYGIGRYMCSGSPWDLNKNPAWALSDDGIT